jgi:hypothetical protein
VERLVQSCDLLGRERDLQPRDLRRADADLGRDPRDGVYDDPALLGRPVPAGRPHAVGGRAAIAEVLARQLTATEGLRGRTPIPSGSAIGSSSPSDVRSSSEYSSCSAVIGAQPRKRAIVWAWAATHAGTSKKQT